MALRRGLSRVQTIGARRKTTWGLAPGSTAPVATTTPGSVFIGAAIAFSVDGITVVRIRGRFKAWLNLATAAQDGFAGAFGIGIASAAAVTAGIASVPTPLSDQSGENWLYWSAFSIKSPKAFAADTVPVGEVLSANHDEVVDSKAMRKVGTEQVIYTCFEVVEVGTAGMQAYFDGRMLIKLA